MLVFRDITERRRLEEHLRQAQKMEAIGQLAGGIAHDFNNIMTVIIGFSELLLAGNLLPKQRQELVRQYHRAGMRAAMLTQQIMAFSRKQMLMPLRAEPEHRLAGHGADGEEPHRGRHRARASTRPRTSPTSKPTRRRSGRWS